MPRKQATIVERILEYYQSAPVDAVEVVDQIARKILQQRKQVRGRPAPQAEAAAPAPAATAGATGAGEVAPQRKRRQRAGSPRPANEATPIVPLQERVGEEDSNTNVD